MNSKQRAYLKSLANELEVIVKIGDKGITENLIKSLDEALVKRELVKASMAHPLREIREQTAKYLATATNSELIHVMGKTMLFFRENPDNPVISKKLKKV